MIAAIYPFGWHLPVDFAEERMVTWLPPQATGPYPRLGNNMRDPGRILANGRPSSVQICRARKQKYLQSIRSDKKKSTPQYRFQTKSFKIKLTLPRVRSASNSAIRFHPLVGRKSSPNFRCSSKSLQHTTTSRTAPLPQPSLQPAPRPVRKRDIAVHRRVHNRQDDNAMHDPR